MNRKLIVDLSARWIHDFDVSNRVPGDGFNFSAKVISRVWPRACAMMLEILTVRVNTFDFQGRSRLSRGGVEALVALRHCSLRKAARRL
jgi:hypothetical protein